MARNVAPIKNGTTAVARQAKRQDVRNRSAKDTSAEIADRSARDTVSVAAAWSFCVSLARRLSRSPVSRASNQAVSCASIRPNSKTRSRATTFAPVRKSTS